VWRPVQLWEAGTGSPRLASRCPLKPEVAPDGHSGEPGSEHEQLSAAGGWLPHGHSGEPGSEHEQLYAAGGGWVWAEGVRRLSGPRTELLP